MTRIALTLALLLSACTTSVSTVSVEPQPVPEPTEYMPQPAVLIYSDTRGWRHEEGINGGNLALMEIAGEKSLGYFTTQHPEVFNDETLSRFDLIIFNSATGDSLNADEKASFERWLANDGSAILIHGSLDGSQKDWTFYQEELVGPLFISHPAAPQFQDADIVVLSTDHPVMDGLPARFTVNDEWYTFDGVPDGRFVTLAGLDESTYSPRNTVYGPEDLRMGPEPEDHPIVWARCLPDGGRIVSSALGHTAESFAADHHRRLLSNAMDWTRRAGQDDEGCD